MKSRQCKSLVNVNKTGPCALIKRWLAFVDDILTRRLSTLRPINS